MLPATQHLYKNFDTPGLLKGTTGGKQKRCNLIIDL